MRLLLILILLGSTAACTIDKRPRQPKPCTVSENALGAVISCQGQVPVQLNHGINGTNGANGVDGLDGTSVEVLLLCEGSEEYALRIGNALYAVYHKEYTDNKGKVRSYTYLALLLEDTYTTTDGTDCLFTVGPDGMLE